MPPIRYFVYKRATHCIHGSARHFDVARKKTTGGGILQTLTGALILQHCLNIKLTFPLYV